MKEVSKSRNSMISFRVSKAEKLTIQLEAVKVGMNDSDYVRDVLLKK